MEKPGGAGSAGPHKMGPEPGRPHGQCPLHNLSKTSRTAPRTKEPLAVMRTHQMECAAVTKAAPSFVDLTEDIQEALDESGISNGHVTVFSPDTTCALLVNERESGLLEDIKRTIARLSPNGDDARAGILGATSVVLPAVDGRLRLGMWQRVLLVELREPSQRSIVIQIVGD
ncbi:MAG: YjbQ family protein [Actinobacteria bacterium]|nr:YjbQ family protein [Actinomycetota bacterium]